MGDTELAASEAAGSVAAEVTSDAEDLSKFGVQDVPWASIVSGISTAGFQNEVKEDLAKILKNQELILSTLKKIETEIKWTALVEEVTPSVTRIQSLWTQMTELGADHDPPWTQKTLDQEKARWVSAVLDEDNGVKPALTLITNVAKGTVALSGHEKGMIETFFDKVNDHEAAKQKNGVYIKVYHHLRAYLGQLLLIQFKGTAMLVNAYLVQGEKGPAATAAQALISEISAQTDLMSRLTPHLLKALAALTGKKDHVKCRFRNQHHQKVAYASEDFVYLHQERDYEKELWAIEPADNAKSEFYIWSVPHGGGSKIRGGERDESGDGSYDPLQYRNQELSPHKWRFLPSSTGHDFFLIFKGEGKGKAWHAQPVTDQQSGVDQVFLIDDKSGDLVDSGHTQWKFEFKDDAPVVYP